MQRAMMVALVIDSTATILHQISGKKNRSSKGEFSDHRRISPVACGRTRE